VKYNSYKAGKNLEITMKMENISLEIYVFISVQFAEVML